MKRFLTILLFLAICLSSVLLFSSCGKKKPARENNLFSDEGLLLVERNDKYGFIDKTGKEVIPCKYYFATSFSNGYAVVQEKKDDSYYYIKPDGTRLLETPFYRASSFDSVGRAWVLKSENGKRQLIDKDGNTIFTAKSIYSGDNGQYLFKDDSDLWGIVDKNGKILLSARYDDLDFITSVNNEKEYNAGGRVLTDRFVALRTGSKGSTYYLIDLDGNELYTAEKEYRIWRVELFETLLAEGENGGIQLFDRSGKTIWKNEGACEVEAAFAGGVLLWFDDDTNGDDYCQVVDFNGDVIFDSRNSGYLTDDDYFGWNGEIMVYTDDEDEKIGIMNVKTGEIIIPAEYNWLSYYGFDANGLCIGQKEKDGDFVALNRKGEKVFTKSCDDLDAFENTNAPYYIASYKQGTNTSYELVDAKGNLIHTFGTRFRPYDYYDDGFIVCREYEDGSFVGYTIFDSNFKQICSTNYDSIGY